MSYEQRKKHRILLEHMMLRTLAGMFNGDDFKTLILALVDFSENEEEATFPPGSPLEIAFRMIRPQILADSERYRMLQERGRKGGLASAKKRSDNKNDADC